MKKYLFLLLFAFSFACTEDNQTFDNNLREIKEFSITVPDIQDDINTRSILTEELKFKWQKSDTIGIFPKEGSQTYFVMASEQESNTAIFNGGGWALKPNYTYSAYYPFSRKYFADDNKSSIILDYRGQVQEGNNNSAHLGAYDYLASDAVTPNVGEFNLIMKRLGSILRFKLKMPKVGTYTKLTLSAEDEVFVETATLDISGSKPVVSPKKLSKTISLYLNEVSTTKEDEELTFYMITSPVDLSSQSLTVTLTGSDNLPYSVSNLSGSSMTAGKGYSFSGTVSNTQPSDFIQFADSRVKKICVLNWDTNNDGELSYEEASAVTSIGNSFRQDTIITNFNELQYFTGLRGDISNFNECSKLESIYFPEGITSLSMQRCSNLQYVHIPTTVKSIGSFNGCGNLESISLPNKVTYIESFLGCSKLKEINIPYGVTYIGDLGYTSLTEIDIPNTVTSLGSLYSTKLKKIVIPNSVTVFNGCGDCSDLEYVILSNNIKQIPSGAFKNCI